MRRARRRWRRRSPFGRARRSRVYLEAYEEALILRDIEAVGGRASAGDLIVRFPDRYSRRYLGGAMKRMCGNGHLWAGGRRRAFSSISSWAGAPTYELPKNHPHWLKEAADEPARSSSPSPR